jgi:hypothetical protein
MIDAENLFFTYQMRHGGLQHRFDGHILDGGRANDVG